MNLLYIENQEKSFYFELKKIMKSRIYQVDAFTEKLFSGNPAAVCPLDKWTSEEIMQNIASENNLAETAFYVKNNDTFEIRWFTPTVEVDLCGHATLATSYVIFNYENYSNDIINFISPKSGKLSVQKQNDLLTLNFPTDEINRVSLSDDILKCFDVKPTEAYKGRTDLLLVFENEDMIKNIRPDFESILKLDARGVIVTAKGSQSDFVSRFFGPQCGINEDPVTGSAHTSLTPYWAKRLNKNELTAVQLSKRQGFLKCRYLNDRIAISGKCKLYLLGEIFLD